MLGARVLFFCFLILTFGVSAQPLPDRRELSGRIISTKNVPVFGAQIQIRRKETSANAAFWGTTVLSDVAGQFRVPDAEDGEYFITVTAPGYEIWTSPYTLKEYEPPLRIALKRKVSLTFTLLDSEGEPVRNKRATVFGFVTPLGEWQRNNQNGRTLGLTDLTIATGKCALSNLKAGVYHELYVAVHGVGFSRWTGKIEILEGDSHHFELRLQRAPASLRIKALLESTNADEKPRPMGDAIVSLKSVQTPNEQDADLAQWLFTRDYLITHDGTGLLELPSLLPGRYHILVQVPFGCDPKTTFGVAQTVDVETDTAKEVTFLLPPCQVSRPFVEVTLRDALGIPLANREVRLFCEPRHETTGLNLPTAELLKRGLPSSTTRWAQTDAAGKITLYPFWAGTWRISAYELGARLPFRGVGTVNVASTGAQIIIATALNAELPD